MVSNTKLSPSSSSSSSSSNNNEANWAMGFLLVFFHSGNDPQFKSTNNALISKTQSTLFICLLLVFITLLLFTATPFEPTSTRGSHTRRILHQIPQTTPPLFRGSFGNFALQGMGKLYRRGSKAMTDLVVGHVAQGATVKEVTTFLRLVHHSGLLSKSDLVLLFDSPELENRLARVVESECDSFLRFIHLCKNLNFSTGSGSGLTRYMKRVGVDDKDSLWGKRVNSSRLSESTRLSYGSVVGFDSSELDPEDSLSGFLDRAPMGLRRWACYPMLLGRVRRQFKHTMLVDIQNSFVLSDPFSTVRNKTAESVQLWTDSETESNRHGRKNLGRGGPHPNLSLIIGGSRGVRRLASAALTEIVRSVVERKGRGKNSVTESGLVKQLAHSGHLLKNINLIILNDSLPEVSSLVGFNSVDSVGPGLLAFSEYFRVVQRGRGNVVDIDLVIKREICLSHELYSSVYRDCLDSQ